MSFSISPTQSTSALPTRKSRQASSTALSPTSSYFSRQDSFASPNGLSGPPSFSSPVGQGYPSRRPYDSISMSMRQVSSASVSISGTGTSTPDYKRRARRMVERGMIKESEIERDWGNIEPDEVFRRLPVGEVRKVEAKMRTEALGKQAELRSMVGTRYRDLLTSATQITALHNSSIRLSRQLRNIADISSNPDTVAVTAETSTDVSDTDDVLARLPAAAHMKLLLDATEVLYVYLAGKEYLKAAYLWLVARVTKEGLSRMTDEIGATYQPLLQKQWETLLPFRSQIVQQATESLRTGDAGDIKALSETILTIVLLDNLAVPDALSVLLEQRLTALRTILTYTSSSPTVSGRKRSNSKTARSDREQITSTLRNAVLNLLATLSSARAVFDKTALAASDIKTTESLIEKLIRLVQLDSSVPTITAPAPLRRTSSNTSHTHHRRASRLVSISLPAQRPEGGEEPPISTSSTIASLPSAQILLRHLPPSVLTYTPFLTPPTDAQVSEKVSRWTDKAIEVLREATPRWLADMTSVKGIWEVKGAVAELLREGETERRIADSLDVLCVQRIKGVWEADLGELIRLAEAQVAAGVKRLAEESCEADMNPEKHLFSEISFPSTTTTLNTPAVTVPSFIAALKKRSAHRTPILDGILSALEAAVAAIKADRQGLPGQVCGAYTDMVGTTLQDLVDKLRKQLDAAAKIEGERKMYGELLVGRVALFIATTSSMFSDLTELDAKSETIDDLLDIHTQSTHTWLSTSIAAALAHLQPLFSSSRPPEVDQTWQAPLPLGPSAEVMHSLYALTTATRALGIPAGVQRPAVKTLIERYGEEVLQLDGWEGLSGTACAQAAVDLGWVHMILGREVRGELVNAMLEKTPGHLKASLDESLNTIISDSLRRTQLLLQPILILVSPDVDLFTATSAEQAKSTAAASRSGAGKWLRFGPPANQLVFPRLPEYPETDDASESVKSTGENGDSDKAAAMTSEKAAEATRTVPDFRSPVAVAKPGKRFNLLSITS